MKAYPKSVRSGTGSCKEKRGNGSSSTQRIGRMLLSCSAALGLSACVSLGLEQPPRIFDLQAPTSIDVGSSRTSRQLLVAEPSAVRFYATDRIVVRDSDATLAYFPAALWSDTLPDLFQARFAEALERTGRARAVGRPGQGLLIDVSLVPEIRAFEIVISESGTAEAVVDIALKVMNDANGRVLASNTFAGRVPASSDATEDAVGALNVAFDALVREMVVFVLDAV